MDRPKGVMALLMRWDPFGEFDRLAQNLGGGAFARRPGVPMDAYRKGDRFVVEFDLPGMNPETIDLTVERNVLTLRAERTWIPAEDEETIVSERPRGSFTRQVFLGETLDTEHLTADYENGVLTVSIPVLEAAKPRKIEVASGSRQAIGVGQSS